MSEKSSSPEVTLSHAPPGDQPLAAAYTVPALTGPGVSGHRAELIMLLSTLALASGIFLPFLSYDGLTLSLFGTMRLLLTQWEAILGEGLLWPPPALILVIMLMVLGSWLALISPRRVWPALTLALSMGFPAAALALFRFMSRLLLGAQSRDMGMGAGLILMLASDIVLCVVCVLSLSRRR